MERLGLDQVRLPGDGPGETASLPLPPVKLVDMRQELKQGNRSIFSRALQEELAHVLENGQQAILFLNRRGSSSYVFCRNCGLSLRCPRCDFPLTYHSEGEALTCHMCGYRRDMPHKCPKCGSAAIRQLGTGTEKVESEVQALFPEARILRWDAETTRQKGSHDLILSHFSNHHADLLVGTQMLAKGLDLPLVTLVGVVLAEVGLNLPDYRAGERVFQLLTQVAGRAGRSPLGGQVILQTFQPEHYVIQAAAKYDFDGFYALELDKRRQIGYPPFCRLARLEFRHLQNEQAERAAQMLAEQLKLWIQEGGHSASEIIGPAPCYFSRLSGYYRWQVLLRSPDPAAILRGRSLQGWRVEMDPVSVL
jgi:primosomal protein N' (replication factor Y)